jgi:hypothetical protein
MGDANKLWASILAVSVFAVGSAVYLLERPVDTVFLLPSWWEVFQPQPRSSWLGQHLPGFAHVFSFSLLTAMALGSSRKALLWACLFWTTVNLVFELGQINFIAMTVSGQLADGPVLNQLASYLVAGTFDPVDIIFILAGGLSAWLTVVLTRAPEGRT